MSHIFSLICIIPLWIACTGSSTSVAGHTLESPSSVLDHDDEVVEADVQSPVEDAPRPAIPETAESLEELRTQFTPQLEAQLTPQLEAPEAGPILNEQLHVLRYAAQRSTLGGGSPPGPRAWPYAQEPEDVFDQRLPGEAPPLGPIYGHWVPLQNEESLESFHLALRRLAHRKQEKVRILAYGASHTQADIYTGYLRNYLQSRFGNGGEGFVHIAKVNKWYKTAHTKIAMKGLRIRHAQSLRKMEDEPLGLFGALAYGKRSGSYGEIQMRKSSENTLFELAYLKQPQGGDFRLLVDGQLRSVIKTQSKELSLDFAPFVASEGERLIRAQLIGGKKVGLLGLIAETDGPGLVVDTLGIGGSRMANQLRWHESLWAEAIRLRQPDLVVYAFGSNETMDTHERIETYEANIREVIARLRRAVPTASCLLMSPFDFPKKQGESYPTRARLIQILEVQRRVADQTDCAYFDAYAFMGGNGSMQNWAMAHPPMARSDRLHLTPLGYVAAGIALGDAIMRKYDAQKRAGLF